MKRRLLSSTRILKAGAFIGAGLVMSVSAHSGARAQTYYPCSETVAYNPGPPTLGVSPGTLECSTLDGTIPTPISMNGTNGSVVLNSSVTLNTGNALNGTGGIFLTSGEGGILLNSTNDPTNPLSGGDIIITSGSKNQVQINAGQGGLVVSGGATNLQQGLTVSGGVTDLQQGLIVSGGTINLNDNLTVTGDTNLNNSLTVTGPTNLNNSLTVTGPTNLNNSLTVTGPTDLKQGLTVTGATNLNDQLTVTGATDLKQGLTVGGATNLNNSLTVTGPTDLKQGLTVAGGPTDLNQGLNVNGQTNIIGGINQQVTDINGGSRFAVDALGATITNQTAAGLARISASNGVISLDSNTQNNTVRGFSIASSTDSLNGARYSSGLTNGTQSTGLTVLPTATTLSGGGLNNPSQLSLTATGASFGNGSSGAPITVTGVADGVNPYDAVNMRQLNQMTNIVSTGVASIAAMSNIPDLSPTKKFGIGVGYGNFQGNSAVAIGASGRLSSALTVKASVGSGYNSNTSVGTGLTFSW
jgi:hypothetical protein